MSKMITSTGRDCEHKNGFFHTIRFWIFKRKGLACEDCGRMVWQERWKINL